MKTNLYIAILVVFISCTNNSNKTTGIQPYGKFNTTLIDTLENTIKKIYGFDVIKLENKPLPKSTFINVKSPRYRADKLLAILKEEKPDSIDHVLGLTLKDISTTKKDLWGNTIKPESKYEDWGVFGLGYCPGESCIVSTHRIKSNPSKFVERFKKICIHEIGHNLGLKHCPNEECVMRDAAESIKTIDLVKLNLCDKCKHEIE
ncbi:MAG: matrixin family metalloprotease [Flavobacteriales bacterium]|nr:matrixin family metalloprotease [Flavobacteriales bacterium]